MRCTRTLTGLLAVSLAAALSSTARAHMAQAAAPPPQPPKPELRLEKVGEGAYCLYGRGGNIGVVVAPAAILLVDDQFAEIAPVIEAEVRKLGDAPIRWVVNTHHHFDHTGGNAHFSKSAELVGHANVRRRLIEDPPVIARVMPERIGALEGLIASSAAASPEWRGLLEQKLRLAKVLLNVARGFNLETVAAPALTYDTAMTLYLGDEEVKIFHHASGHTDGDSVVWFPKRNVVHMGDQSVTGSFPFIDVDAGGQTEGWIRSLDAVLGVLPPDARVIPGHGGAAGVMELRRFRAYLSDLRTAVAGAIRSGRSLPEAVGAIRLEAYSDLKPGVQTLPSNIDQVWTEMNGPR